MCKTLDTCIILACVAGVKRGGGRGGGREFGQKTPPPLYTPATQASIIPLKGK